MSPPRNLFALVETARHSILIAGGIGITPMVAMTEALLAAGASFELHYGARARSRAAFLPRLAAPGLAGRVHTAFDDEAAKLDLEHLLANPADDVHVYVCGPAGLIDAVVATAAARGWAPANVHREFFAAAPTEAAPGAPFTVVAARSNVQVEVAPGTTIANALLDAGVNVPLFCEQGICGSCQTMVLEGEPDHRDQFLLPADRAAGQMLVCCSRSHGQRLVLDI